MINWFPLQLRCLTPFKMPPVSESFQPGLNFCHRVNCPVLHIKSNCIFQQFFLYNSVQLFINIAG